MNKFQTNFSIEADECDYDLKSGLHQNVKPKKIKITDGDTGKDFEQYVNELIDKRLSELNVQINMKRNL